MTDNSDSDGNNNNLIPVPAGCFNAHSVAFAFCSLASCAGLHMHLLDAAGRVRAQAVMSCDSAEQMGVEIILLARSRHASQVRH